MENLIFILVEFVLITTFIINVFLFVLIFFKGRKKLSNKIFLVLLFCIIFWQSIQILLDIMNFFDLDYLMVLKLSIVCPIFIPYLFFLFIVEFNQIKIKNFWLFVLSIPPLILLTFTPTKYNASYIKITEFIPIIEVGSLYFFFSIYFVIYLVLSFIFLFNYDKEDLIKKIQVQLIFWGSLFSAGLGVITNSILLLFNKIEYTVFGAPSVVIFTLCVSYAILKYRFLDIKFIFKKSLIYSLLFIILFGVYTFFILLFGRYIQDNLNLSFLFTTAMIAFFIAIIFQPIKDILQKGVFNVFNKNELITPVENDDTYQKLNGNIVLENILNKFKVILKNSLNIKEILILLLDDKKNFYNTSLIIGRTKDTNYSFTYNNIFITAIKRIDNIVIKDEIPFIISTENNDAKDDLLVIHDILNKINMYAVVEIGGKEEKIGLLFLGKKSNNKPYSVNDVKYIKESILFVYKHIHTALMYKYALERIKRDYSR